MFDVFRRRTRSHTYFTQAISNYSVYLPPHRTEERVLSKYQAQENYDFFMKVKDRRLDDFLYWMKNYFALNLPVNSRGVYKIDRWLQAYNANLLNKAAGLNIDTTYFDYKKNWRDGYAGLNVIFDIGIFIGEAFMFDHPKTNWTFGSVDSFLPRTARLLKRDSCSSYQRPEIVGGHNPAWHWSTLHDSYIYTHSMHVFELKSNDRIGNSIKSPSIYKKYKGLSRIYPNFGIAHDQNGKDLDAYLRSLDAEE